MSGSQVPHLSLDLLAGTPLVVFVGSFSSTLIFALRPV